RWQALGSHQGGALRAVWAAPEDAAEELWAVGDGGVILRSSGGTIGEVPSGTGRNLYAIWGAAADDLWTVGQWGEVLHFDGEAWARVGTGTGRLALFGLFGSGHPDGPGRIFAVGASGGVLRYRAY